jgi:ribosomal protein S18 acetylase RimI-like enzyme
VTPDTPWSLRPLAASDADAVQRLWNRRFGGDAARQRRWIEAALNPDHTATAAVASPSNSSTVVAFGLLEVGGVAYTRRYLSLDSLGLEPSLAPQNGLLHMYCVRREWSGWGIGTALYAHHLQDLSTRDVPRAFGIAWHRPHTTDSRALFEKYSFRCLSTVEAYYGRFERRHHCPDCGGRCSCTASLYARSVMPQ